MSYRTAFHGSGRRVFRGLSTAKSYPISVSSRSVLTNNRNSSALNEVRRQASAICREAGAANRDSEISVPWVTSSVDSQSRYECDANTRRNHLHQRVQAAGLELRPCFGVAESAHVKRVTAQTVAFLQQHQLFALKRIERHRVGAGERVGPVTGEQKLILADDVQGEVCGVVGQGDESHVKFSVLQTGEQRSRLLLPQVHRQLRESTPQRRQDARQEEGADRWDDPEAQFPRQRRAAGPGHLHDLFGIAQQRPCPLGNLRTGLRDQHMAVGTLRDRRAERRPRDRARPRSVSIG